jgi:hypothetical protein
VGAADGPQIVVDYRSYTPNVDVVRIVQSLMQRVPAQFLRSLRQVTLTNIGAGPRHERRRRVRSRGLKRHATDALAVYHKASRSGAAEIEIFVDQVLDGIPRVVQLIPPIRDLLFARTLYHELGHHIHYTSHPQRGEPEDIADEWARKFIASFVRAKYWYAIPFVRATAVLLRWKRS